MYKPDRVILRKVKEYDRHLTIRWNDQKRWFELWYETVTGWKKITAITQSIYDARLPREFVQLDERILWWIYEADSAHRIGKKQALDELDRRWVEYQKQRRQSQLSQYRDGAKEMWNSMHAFYTRKVPPKNAKPTFNTKAVKRKWIAPDVQLRGSGRLFQRSAANARRYFGGQG